MILYDAHMEKIIYFVINNEENEMYDIYCTE